MRFKPGRVLYNVSIVRSEGRKGGGGNKTTRQMTRNHLLGIKIIKPTDISKHIVPFLSPLRAMVLICYQDRSSNRASFITDVSEILIQYLRGLLLLSFFFFFCFLFLTLNCFQTYSNCTFFFSLWFT